MAEALGLGREARVVFLTGAGISVASGIRPFRGPGGIWNDVYTCKRSTSCVPDWGACSRILP